MVKCNKCTKDIAPTKDGSSTCVSCQAQFHNSCVSECVTRGSQKSWKCVKCCSEQTDTIVKPTIDYERVNEIIVKAIAVLKEDMKNQWDVNNKKLDSIQEEMSNMNKDITFLKTKMDEIVEKATSTETRVQQLTDDNCKLHQELAVAKREIHDLQIQTRKNNIVISGIPIQSKGTNVFPIIIKIAELLKLTYYQTDINAAHWLPVRGGEPRSQSIVVSFVSRLVKNEWLLARRHKRFLKAREIDNDFPDVQIYLNEQLTKDTSVLFKTARSMIKENKMASVWTNDGRVMAKRTPTSRPFRVNCLKDLEERTPPATASEEDAAPIQADGAPLRPTATNANSTASLVK
ncbi:uncharacterized protein LOC120349611 [Nilaparvata lugens]|uniref:uncharacterized protein LOC120349611 n=1 Tax=Nilaparvata lugens TaxID=108931 RepID=UPI00193E45B0|nr:uncharacterized protein LOC120349611 [Nilaparvata lugens]